MLPGWLIMTCVCARLFFSIYIVHDEVKDKAFELELSWVGESKSAKLPWLRLSLRWLRGDDECPKGFAHWTELL